MELWLLGHVNDGDCVFNAVGKPLPSTALSFARMVVHLYTSGMCLITTMAIMGIFIATLVSKHLLGIAAYFWFRTQLTTMSQAYS